MLTTKLLCPTDCFAQATAGSPPVPQCCGPVLWREQDLGSRGPGHGCQGPPSVSHSCFGFSYTQLWSQLPSVSRLHRKIQVPHSTPWLVSFQKLGQGLKERPVSITEEQNPSPGNRLCKSSPGKGQRVPFFFPQMMSIIGSHSGFSVPSIELCPTCGRCRRQPVSLTL